MAAAQSWLAETASGTPTPGPRQEAWSRDVEPRVGDSTRTRWMDRYARILAGVDLLAALVGVALALLRTEPNVPRWMALAAAVLLPLSWLAALTMARCYEPRFLGDGGDPLRRLLDIGLRFMGVIGLYALIDEGTFSRLLSLLALPFMLAVGATARLVGDVVLRRAQRRGVATHRAIVVGTERAVDELLHRLDSSSDHAIVVVTDDEYPFAGGDHAYRLMANYRPDELSPLDTPAGGPVTGSDVGLLLAYIDVMEV